jgi:hypothetical protein
VDNPAYTTTGMLIAVSRRTEVAAMARDLAPYRDALCVTTQAAQLTT